MAKRIEFINFLENVTSFVRNDATSPRVWIFQDRNGTIADDTDIAGRVPTSRTVNGQALSGDVTLSKSDIGLSAADNTSDATKNAAAVTLTNKRIVPRIQSVVSAATITPSADNDDMVKVTALAEAATIAAPSGTPVEGQSMLIRIKDNGTSRALTYNAIYRDIAVTRPSATTISKTIYLGLVYNLTDTKWDILSVSIEA
jgi:hypothetical protein